MADDSQRTSPAPRSPSQSPAGNSPQRTHRKKTSPLLFVIPIVLVAAAVGLFLVLRGGGAGGIIPFVHESPEPVPPFDFQVGTAGVEATSEKTDPKDLAEPAQAVSDAVVPVIDQLYTDGFVDPNVWKDGDYGDIWDLFEGDAVASAQGAVDTLTLGANAGDVFDSVEPLKGSLKVRVLFDENGKAVSAVAIASFKAYAAGTDGTYSRVVSKGQFFLRETGDGWRIYSFEVRRADEPAKPPKPSPSASGSSSS